MRWLLFLSRLSFICGICFLISLGFLMMKKENNEPFSQTLVVIGHGMGLLVVPATVLCYVFLSAMGKKINAFVPRWLMWMNVLFVFVLLFYLFYQNDSYYTQK